MTSCAALAPYRPVLRWHGGKWRLAPWIVGLMPEHQVYVEPFGGAASVLLRKPRSKVEVYNDLDQEVVNLFRVLRGEQAEELLRRLRLTPFARAEFDAAYAPADDPVERARALVVRSFMGFGSNGHARRTGFRGKGYRAGALPQHDWIGLPDSLEAVIARLAGVVIESSDAFEVLTRYDEPAALFYVDPPYLAETRDRGRDYRHEMSGEAHAALLDALAGLRGRVILSGYPSETYDRRLAGWCRMERATCADGARRRIEVLWMNFEPRASLTERLL